MRGELLALQQLRIDLALRRHERAHGFAGSGLVAAGCFLGFGASDGDRGPGPVEDCGWREEVVQVRGYVRGRGDGPLGAARAN